jgi:hypothetical protein
MRNDQIFVLLLVVLLPLSGCFDGGGVGEAEGAQDSDETSGTTVVNHYYNNTTTSQNSQERTWHSSGEIVNKYWNDGQDVASGIVRCLEYGASFDSETGEYLGEECKETDYPDSISDWNNSDCIGELTESSTGMMGGYNPRYAPSCTIIAKTINTNPGEALILYEMQSISIATTCGGVLSSTITQIGGYYGGEESAIVPGSALSCSHDISFTQSYQQSSSAILHDMKIWSVVYAIQDTVVV